MPTITITSHFSKDGIPSTGLTPTIRIWEISNTNQLLIGSPDGIQSDVDGIMTEIVSQSGTKDGFYKFDFTDVMGYVKTKQYVVRIDGGVSEHGYMRFQVSQITPITEAVDVVNAILDEPAINHTQLGSIGQKINEMSTNTEQLTISLIDVQDLLRLIIKYDTNRTKIDVTNHTLTVYDDDCSTPLRTFKLFDSFGQPSVADVVERKPIASGTTDGQPTCI